MDERSNRKIQRRKIQKSGHASVLMDEANESMFAAALPNAFYLI
jgi:hypothetical protein